MNNQRKDPVGVGFERVGGGWKLRWESYASERERKMGEKFPGVEQVVCFEFFEQCEIDDGDW